MICRFNLTVVNSETHYHLQLLKTSNVHDIKLHLHDIITVKEEQQVFIKRGEYH